MPRMPRKRSGDSSVHRDLVTVDPPQRGRDVANVNRASRARLRIRGLTDDVPAPTHDKFTEAAALAAIEAQYALGVASATYLTVDQHGRRVLTRGAQRVIRNPATRNPAQRVRARRRRARVSRGPRYGALPAAPASPTGAERAVAFAISHIGTCEHPAGSNSGPSITGWQRAAGYTAPVPWCACFANACLMAAGLPSGADWGIGYTPTIVAHAKAGIDGWQWIGPSGGRRGDLALFDNGPGGDVAVHVEVVEERRSPSSYGCIGGNTTPAGMSGSQANGGMVGRTDRTTAGAFRIIGFARPPYDR